MGPVDLVTADGSIDCSGSPNEQEEIVAQLHFCEVTSLLPSACIPVAGKRRELLFCGCDEHILRNGALRRLSRLSGCWWRAAHSSSRCSRFSSTHPFASCTFSSASLNVWSSTSLSCPRLATARRTSSAKAFLRVSSTTRRAISFSLTAARSGHVIGSFPYLHSCAQPCTQQDSHGEPCAARLAALTDRHWQW
jgi:hypothetical protein